MEKSWHAHLEYPDSVICNYGYRYSILNNNEFASYNSWRLCYEGGCDNIFFGSGGGTLYKPSMMYKELTNIEKALALAPTADDVWLNAMARKNNTNVVLLPNGQFLPIKNKCNHTLTSINVSDSQNDTQLKAVWEYLKLYYHNSMVKTVAEKRNIYDSMLFLLIFSTVFGGIGFEL